MTFLLSLSDVSDRLISRLLPIAAADSSLMPLSELQGGAIQTRELRSNRCW
jgi:hypothetical protein